MKLLVEVDGVKVYSSITGDRFIAQRRRRGYKDFCALSGVEIPLGSDVVLLFSNFRLFPNCMVLASELSSQNYEAVIRKIIKSWNEAQKYKHWFT